MYSLAGLHKSAHTPTALDLPRHCIIDCVAPIACRKQIFCPCNIRQPTIDWSHVHFPVRKLTKDPQQDQMDVNGLRTAVDVGCVVTRDSDLHGTGLFATEALEAGNEILADTPLADFQFPESSERPLDDIVDHIRNLPNDAVREFYPMRKNSRQLSSK